MSISTAIQNAQEKVRNAYTAVSDKGGTVPTVQNLNNLPEAINSISGGGGDVVEAYALDGAKNAQVGDKVVLNNPVAANTMLMDGVEAPATYYQRYTGAPYKPAGGIISSDSIFAAVNSQDNGDSYLRSFKGSRVSDTEWSLSRTTDSLYKIYACRVLDPIRKFAVLLNNSGCQVAYYNKGTFAVATALSGTYTRVLDVELCKDMIGCSHREGVKPLFYNGSSFVSTGNSYFYFIKYYGGKYYAQAYDGSEYKYSEEDSTWSSTGHSISGLPYDNDFSATASSFKRCLGDYSGKFFIASVGINAVTPVYVYERVSGIPGESNQTYQINVELSKPFTVFDSKIICCDTYMDPVDGYTYIFIADFNCNQVYARFKGGAIEVLPPPFDKSVVGNVRTITMNKAEDLFMCASVNPNEAGRDLPIKFYVKSADVVAPFEFVANSFADRYIVSDSLTGFVQDTREGFGSKILTVATVKDPNKEPWDPIGKLFGFKVTVKKGE